MTGMKVNALIAKQMGTPKNLIIRPARAGPMILAPLKMLLFNEIALRRCFLPTSSTTKAWRAGASKAFTVPSPKAIVPTIARLKTGCAPLTTPEPVRPARTTASVIADSWVASSRRRLGMRSAATPPQRPKSRMGRDWIPVTTPSIRAEWEIVHTSQPWATCWVQVPTRETSWPKKKSR